MSTITISNQILTKRMILVSLKEDLNGVDFDWEQPSTQQEYSAYLHLIVEAADEFHRSGLLVSVALHPHQLLPKEVYSHVDRIHLMAYDMIESNGVHHASFNNGENCVIIHYRCFV